MESLVILATMLVVIWLYFKSNPMNHGKKFMWRRFVNWFPLGMTYGFLYMARYNLNVAKNALDSVHLMDKSDFGLIFGIGTAAYGFSFLFVGPLVDRIGGKKGIVIAALGSSMMNVFMGLATFLYLKGQVTGNVVLVYTILYSLNMFFQSYGAVSIIKVKAYWFHVRERGVFGAIFGTLISVGVYFAFDWGPAIADAAVLNQTKSLNFVQQFIRTIFAVETGTTDATWLVFFIPAFLLIVWALIDTWLIRDTPSQTGHDDFDTADASSGEMEVEYTKRELLKKFFSNPVLLTVALVEFTTGVLRNGIFQWYFIFAKEVPQVGAEYFKNHWGFLLAMTGITGSFAAGWLSDHVFHSRRGPPAVIMSFITFILTSIMASVLFSSPIVVGLCAIFVSFAVTGVHGLMSGTAAPDFGGRKLTATASGITDGCVYLGSGIQSVCLGYLTTKNWVYWPMFLAPFALLGGFFAFRMWKALPAATKKYLVTVEKVRIEAEVIRVEQIPQEQK